MAGSRSVAVAGCKDRFQDLPEPVLELLLSFMPSRDAVRTSVLARRWRSLWKSVPALILPHSLESARAFSNFVSKLLECRDRRSPLRECDITCFMDDDYDGILCYVESWVQYAVSCRVSVLRVATTGTDRMPLKLSNNSVVSKHLTRVELCRVDFGKNPLDLLSCQALEVLEIEKLYVNLGDVFPNSLRRLKLRTSRLYSTHAHTPRNRLSAPGLVTFELADCYEWTPLLESLPSLVTSFIRIDLCCEDACYCGKYLGDCGKESCDGCYGEDDRSVLLEGLSGATNLELISDWSLEGLEMVPYFWQAKNCVAQ